MRITTAGDPGEEHERLAALSGAWSIERKEWRDANQPRPATNKILCECRAILGGRFLQISTTWKAGGRRHQELFLLGCDRRSGVYTMQAMDSKRSWATIASGKWVASKRSIVFQARDENPLTKSKTELDLIFRFVDKAHWTLTTYETQLREDGKTRFKSLEHSATRNATARAGR